jgi:hypothetical protein
VATVLCANCRSQRRDYLTLPTKVRGRGGRIRRRRRRRDNPEDEDFLPVEDKAIATTTNLGDPIDNLIKPPTHNARITVHISLAEIVCLEPRYMIHAVVVYPPSNETIQDRVAVAVAVAILSQDAVDGHTNYLIPVSDGNCLCCLLLEGLLWPSINNGSGGAYRKVCTVKVNGYVREARELLRRFYQ